MGKWWFNDEMMITNQVAFRGQNAGPGLLVLKGSGVGNRKQEEGVTAQVTGQYQAIREFLKHSVAFSFLRFGLTKFHSFLSPFPLDFSGMAPLEFFHTFVSIRRRFHFYQIQQCNELILLHNKTSRHERIWRFKGRPLSACCIQQIKNPTSRDTLSMNLKEAAKRYCQLGLMPRIAQKR